MQRTLRTLKSMAGDLVHAWRAVEHARSLAERLEDTLTRDERRLSRYVAR